MSTITRTSDSVTTTPTFIQGYEATYTGANVLHELVDGGTAVTLMPHRLRTGTLSLYYTTRADAWASTQLHLAVDTFTLTDPDVTEVDMLYSADDVAPVLEIPGNVDAETDGLWLVRVDFTELPT